MKRKISLILAVLMICNLFVGMLSAQAESILAENYEFMDTAYDPNTGTYLALAKDFTKDTTGANLPLKIYSSSDGLNWEEVYSVGNAYLNSNRLSKQTLVWWDAAGVFVLSIGHNMQTSPDGKNWTVRTGITRGNGIVDTDGEQLLTSATKASKIVNPEDMEATALDFHCFAGNGNTVLASGITPPDENGKRNYVAIGKWQTWIYDGTIVDSGAANADYAAVTTVGHTYEANPCDVVYEPNSQKWLIIDGTQNLTTLSISPPAYKQITVGDDGEAITAVDIIDNMIVVGKANGGLYVTPADGEIGSDTQWTSAIAGNNDFPMTEEVRGIVDNGNGQVIILTKNKIFLGNMMNDTLMYYDISAADVKMDQGEKKIIVPVTGTEQAAYSFSVYDFKGQPADDTVAKVEMSDQPEGVTFTGTELTVTPQAPAGEVTITVTTQEGIVKDFKILLVREGSIAIDGSSSLAIPAAGDITQSYTAQVLGTDGEVMEQRTATLSVEGNLPAGITFADNQLTVNAAASAATVTLKAVSDTDPTIAATKEISIKERSPETVVISGEDTITVNGGALRQNYTAKVVDQAGIEMPEKTVTWSISGIDTGAQISQDGALLLYGVKENTQLTLKVVCNEFPSVYGEKKIKIVYKPVDVVLPDVVPSADYQFIDTEYSPELGVFVGIGKGILKNEKSHGAEIYRSEDGTKWNKVHSIPNGTNSRNPRSRQVVVWWEKEHTFVAAFAGSVYASPDGLNWTLKPNLSVASNLNLSTNGEKLLIGAEKSLYIVNSIDETPEADTFSTNDNASTIATLDNKGRYLATGHYITWNKQGKGAFEIRYPNLEGEPTELQYSEGLDRWLFVNNKAQLKSLIYPATQGIYSINLSDGTVNGQGLTALRVGSDANVLGTANGGIYVFENGDQALSTNSVWKIAEPGMGNEAITETIGSISQIDTGRYLVASYSKMYMLINKNGTWTYYELVQDKMILPEEQLRIEVPFEESIDVVYRPEVVDYKGETPDNPVVSFYPVSPIPEGVTFDCGGDYDGITKLTVDSTVKGQSEMIMEALFADGTTSQHTIIFVTETKVKLTVNDQLPLPTTEAESWDVKVEVLGSDDKPMDRIAVVEMDQSSPQGVTFDPAAMKLHIEVGAQAGVILLKAHSKNKNELIDEKKIILDTLYTRTVKIIDGEDRIIIPDEKHSGYPYTAQAYDQAGRVIANGEITWQVAGAEGVTIDQEGKLYIPTTLYACNIDVTAQSTGNPNATDKKTVALELSDYRHTLEDAKELQLDFSNVKKNMSLPTEGKWGSVIKWISSDESVITNGGVITRHPKKDTKATMNVTIVYTNAETGKSAKTSLVYPVTVKRAENLFANGDVEKGLDEEKNLEGFNSEATLEVVEEDVRNGKYALKVGGDSVNVEGNKLEGNSSYYYEAYVKAPAGSEISMVSKKNGTLNTVKAETGYTLITGFIYAAKAADDVITINVKGVDEFLLDDTMYIDITEVYDAVTRALSTAESTKKQTDYDKAEALVEDFYDVPQKEELRKRLRNIKVNDGNDNNTNKPRPGNGGGGGSSSHSNTAPVVTLPNNQEQQDEKVSDYLLIFKDLKNHWAKDDIEYMAEKGIVSGREEGVFDPEAPITRAEFAVLITKTVGLTETPYENTFFDVVEDDWYSGYVQAARNAGYITGSNGLYRPNDNITREEIAKIIVSAYAQKTGTQIETGGALYYNDLADISSWAYDYIVNAVNLEFVKGISEYSFAPKATATRAQAAVMLKRLLDKLPQ